MRTFCLVVLVGLAAPALAQDAAAQQPAAARQPAAQPTAAIDEIIVPGQTPENLRLEIERLEVAVYDRFNALNSNDDFDIHCLSQAPTGSNIPVRTCAPNFVVRVESTAARRMLNDGRGGAGNNNNPAEQDMLMQKKSRELTEEMQRIAREDEQLLRDLVRLDQLKQLETEGQASRARR